MTQAKSASDNCPKRFVFSQLVADIRQQCNVSCTLDRCCQFTLMECTSAGNSARQNLCTLSHALLQSCNILIINALYTIHAEHANLFPRSLSAALRSFSLHADISSYLQCGIHFRCLSDQNGTSPSLRISSKSPRSPSCNAPGACAAAGAGAEVAGCAGAAGAACT